MGADPLGRHPTPPLRDPKSMPKQWIQNFEVPGLELGTTQIFHQPGNRDFAKSDHLSIHDWPLVQPFPT